MTTRTAKQVLLTSLLLASSFAHSAWSNYAVEVIAPANVVKSAAFTSGGDIWYTNSSNGKSFLLPKNGLQQEIICPIGTGFELVSRNQTGDTVWRKLVLDTVNGVSTWDTYTVRGGVSSLLSSVWSWQYYPGEVHMADSGWILTTASNGNSVFVELANPLNVTVGSYGGRISGLSVNGGFVVQRSNTQWNQSLYGAFVSSESGAPVNFFQNEAKAMAWDGRVITWQQGSTPNTGNYIVTTQDGNSISYAGPGHPYYLGQFNNRLGTILRDGVNDKLWSVFDGESTVTSRLNSLEQGWSSGKAFSLAPDGEFMATATRGGVSYVVKMTPVPEPATMVALGIGFIAVLKRRKK